ncbi:MAG: sensor histidine kinase, partial [Xanthomonadales bacterium]|nr:sensor histidine kinase [Xanthomonadales bacterium]
MVLNEERFRPLELLRYAGLFIWLALTIPLVFIRYVVEEPFPPEQYLAWWALHVLFGLTYWNQVRELPLKAPLSYRIVTLSVLTGSALAICLASETSGGGILLLVVAGLVPWILDKAAAIAWVLVQSVLLAIVVSTLPGMSFADASVNAGLFLSISLFAFISSYVALRQHTARDELRKVNSELRATQALLAENTRIAERVRISRELHDLVGHHLTALTLNLEVATHLVQGKALEHVQQAHSLAKLLLADVREVVSDMRDDDKVDLAAALSTLVEGVPHPRIHLDLPTELAMTDPGRAQVLLRCAQEVITNTVRHAEARNLWLRLRLNEDGIDMRARDDGRGVDNFDPGNGLKGMSERIRALGGTLEVTTSAGKGFALRAWLPLESDVLERQVSEGEAADERAAVSQPA